MLFKLFDLIELPQTY